MTIIRQKAEVVMGEALRLKRCDGKIAERKAAVEREISELRARTVLPIFNAGNPPLRTSS